MPESGANQTISKRLQGACAWLFVCFFLVLLAAMPVAAAQGTAGSNAESSAVQRAPLLRFQQSGNQYLELLSVAQLAYIRCDLQHFPHVADAQDEVSPESVWRMPSTQLQLGRNSGLLHLDKTRSLVARFRIEANQSGANSYVAVPVPGLDRVDFWFRSSAAAGQHAGPWKRAYAGDHVAHTEWPFIGPYAAFQLPSAHGELDVVMQIHNQTPLFVHAYLQTSRQFHEGRNFYSNGTGASLGLLGAVALVCLLVLRMGRVVFFWLFGLALFSFLLYMARSGVGHFGFWSNSLRFNDIAMVLFASLTSVSLLMVVAHLLPTFRSVRKVRMLYRVMAGLGLVLAALIVLVLDYATAIVIYRFYVVPVLLLCLVPPMIFIVMRGDRASVWVASAMGLIVISGLAQTYSDIVAEPDDIWGVTAAVTLSIAIMVFLGGAVGKYQYGSSVMGEHFRIHDFVDGLTGLLNSKGFENKLSLTVLAAGTGPRKVPPVITVMMFRLPTLERQEFQNFGKTISNQIEVRLAAVIKQALPETSVLARVQTGCMTAFITERMTSKSIEAMATKVLSDGLNARDLPNFVSELGMQILIGQVPRPRLSPGVYQALHSFGEVHETSSKAIHWVELSITSTSPASSNQ